MEILHLEHYVTVVLCCVLKLLHWHLWYRYVLAVLSDMCSVKVSFSSTYMGWNMCGEDDSALLVNMTGRTVITQGLM